MLVLGREVDQTIVMTVGEHTITLLVVEVYGGRIRVGIEAPPEVKILRGELIERMKNNEDNS